MERDWQLLKGASEDFDNLLEFTAYPFELMAAIACQKTGQPIPIQEFKLDGLTTTITNLIRMRFLFNIGFNQRERELRRDLDQDMKIRTNKAYISSIIWNLVKNGAKSLIHSQLPCDLQTFTTLFSAEYLELAGKQLPPWFKDYKDKKILLSVSAHNQPEAIEINVSDSGEGISADTVLRQIGKRLINSDTDLNQLKRELTDIVGSESAQVIMMWPGDAFAIRSLPLGNVFDLTAIARLSGFEQEEQGIPSSGMGLWGAKYVVEKLGGSIIATNICGSGAAFRVTIPKISVV